MSSCESEEYGRLTSEDLGNLTLARYPAISPDYKCLSFLWNTPFLFSSFFFKLYCYSELFCPEFDDMAYTSSIEKEKPQDEMLEEKVAEVRKAPGITEVSPEDAARTRRILLKLDFRWVISIKSTCH